MTPSLHYISGMYWVIDSAITVFAPSPAEAFDLWASCSQSAQEVA